MTGSPGEPCEYADGVTGVVGCPAPTVTACFPPDSNVCGGTALLAARPGSPCGECGGGRIVCSSIDEIECSPVPPGLLRNACGGCGNLDAPLNSECGCGGTWQCAEDEGVECVGSVTNACGGCEELAGRVGDVCDSGSTWQCNGLNEVVCRESDAACDLDGQLRNPGEPCGDCQDGFVVCAGTVGRCVGSTSRNACGGCSPLVGAPGASCGANATWTCNGSTVECVIDPCLNGIVDGEETDIDCGGASCERCGLGLLCRSNDDCQTARCNRGRCASPDRDGDAISDVSDNCPLVFNPNQRDLDEDGLGDACDPDRDGDRIPDTADNCPDDVNVEQIDTDRDGVGDSCQ